MVKMTQESTQLINLNDPKPTQVEQENPFLTSKVKPRHYGAMNTVISIDWRIELVICLYSNFFF